MKDRRMDRVRRTWVRGLGTLPILACGGMGGLSPSVAIGASPVEDRDLSPAGGAPLRVVATFSILADWVAQLGGPWVQVQTLVGPDGDAHAFEPTPQAVRRLAQADVVVANGLHFEGWIDRLVRTSGFRGPVIVASEGLSPRRLGREVDPHAWQDLAHVRRYVHNVTEALARARPVARPVFEGRRQDYLRRLDALEQQVRGWLSQVPPERRRVVTTHDAFGYFGQAWGIEFLAVQGWNRQGEASAAAVARLVQQLRRQHARAVFIENISDPRLIRRLADEAGAVVGGTLYSDALSAPGTVADTFLKFYAHNARTLAEALGVRL